MTIAKLFVPAGAPRHSIGGEMPAPSPVNSSGNGLPDSHHGTVEHEIAGLFRRENERGRRRTAVIPARLSSRWPGLVASGGGLVVGLGLFGPANVRLSALAFACARRLPPSFVSICFHTALAVHELEARRAFRLDLIIHLPRLAADLIRQRVLIGRGLREAGDLRAAQRLGGGARPLRARLRIYLAVALDDFAVKTAVEIRIRFRRVIVIAERGRGVAVEGVELAGGRAAGFGQAVNRIAIQREGHGLIRANERLQMQRGDVVMVIVRAPGVTAEFIQFACE